MNLKRIHFLIMLLFVLRVSAQSPQAFKYQTSIRDNAGNLMSNKLVALRISILQGSATGNVVFAERHNTATNDFGIANLNIGVGIPLQGTFVNINWANGPYFLKIDLDPNNGTNYTFMGTSQLVSVPYALYAANSGNVTDDSDKDSTNELQSLVQTGGRITLTKANTITIDPDTLNEIQQISLNGNTLSLSKNGGQVDLTKYGTDTQSLSLVGKTLSISRGNSIVLSGAVDLDSDPTNELQSLNLRNDSLYLSSSNGIKLPQNNDNDTLNEIQLLSQDANTISLNRNGGTANVPSVTNIQNNSLLYANATGSNQISLTLSTALTAYKPGMIIYFKVSNNNTGHVTVNLNGIGIKPLFKNVMDTLSSKDLRQNQVVSIIYDGSNFQLLTQNKMPVIGDGLILQNDTLKQKFKLDNLYMPGNIDRTLLILPNIVSSVVVPSDTIAIVLNDIGNLNYTWSQSGGNDNIVFVFNSGDTIPIFSGTSISNIIFSKKYVNPIKLSFNQSITVPIGKKLCVTSFVKSNLQNGDNCIVIVNNITTHPIYPGAIKGRLLLAGGSTITLVSTQSCSTNCCTGSFLTGYLFE